MKKTLALVMVVKNEEKGLEKAILSCKDFVDEIVIAVDSKSVDKTADIAERYASHFTIFEFTDDFAEARNYAHSFVHSDYILFLDGHEFVSQFSGLQEALQKDTDGILIRMRMETGAEFNSVRIYKKGMQFEGKIHEKVKCSTIFELPSFLIQHDRLGGQAEGSTILREKQRKYHMEKIMAKELDENPKNTRVLFHLCLYYFSINDFKKAEKYQKAFLKCSNLPGERYYILFHRALYYLSQGKRFRAFLACYKAECEEPERWETEKLRGMIYFEAGKYEKALVSLVNSFNQNKKRFAFQPWQRDDAGTWNLIGECFFRRGAYSKASTAFYMASEQTKDKEQKNFFKQRQELMQKMAVK